MRKEWGVDDQVVRMTLKTAARELINIAGNVADGIFVMSERIMQKTLGRNAEREQEQEKDSCDT